ncbi:OmpA family protein [Rhizobium herbae]|uniref:OmpA family protein n=1 Tax=Rhizobium herbae TaxID=508661 RepID=A0ABS7H4L2_9HYPH|nr:OmpA family protein [Rhizobium herbae]MBW9062169.1 OmpA family protein [Rhizobium herbae]
MTIRSKLFATVAFPMLSMSIAIQPALADSLMKPFEVAQEDGIAQEGGEQSPEELLRKKRKQRAQQQQEQQEQQQSEEAQPSQEEQPSRAERRKKRQEAEQQQQQEAQPSADDEAARQAAEEKQRIRAERRKKRQEAEQQQQEAQPSADDEAAKAAEERAKIRAERKKRQQAEQQQQEEAQPSADDEAAKAAEERARIRAERKKRQAEQQQQEEAQPSADDEAAKAAEERARIRAERKKQRQAEQQQQEEAQPSADDEAAKTAEERAKIRAERRKRQQAEQQQEEGQQPATEDALRPAIDGDAEATETPRKRRDRRQPIPEIVDTRSEEEKQEIARDPAATDETVVLPVEKGAAILDSDKDADNADSNARERRRRLRERARAQEANVEVPKSDEEAQSSRRDRRPTQEELEANIREEGRRVERVPEFNANDLIDAFTGSDSSLRPRIEETRDSRTVLDFGDQIIVRGDDRPRLRRNAQQTYYEELSRSRYREVIERPNGVRIITIYNRYGDIVQRSRIDRDGREYLMIYAPEVDAGPRPPFYDVGEDLPPMRLRVPVRDYIIDTSSEPDRDYYDFLAEPPVEQVERVYSIDEVRNSARIRDKVRRIDLDTITFATGSAEVPMSQAKTLRKVADAMLQVIEKDPGETFFIEGHTDAVGSDESNLVLSDERAESVASLLTEVYDIPAENLVTQGYGERFLKVRTLEAEQENRRVTIRRVTPLVRPVAQN